MLIAVLATLMFFAMLAATFNALRAEMTQVPVPVRAANRAHNRHTYGSR